MRRIYKTILILLLTLSCHKPEINVDFHSLKIRRITLKNIDFYVNLKINYKGSFALKIKDIKYKVYLNQYYLGEGENPGPIKFSRRVDTVIAFPGTVEYKNLPSTVYSLLLKKKLKYTVDVELTVMVGLIRKRIKLKESGEIKP